jgi:D-psicose/D-tagatose/L-ribulose 3-epimerase
MARRIPVPANRLGVHALVFTGRWDAAGAQRAVAAAKAAGYDLIELALLDPRAVDTDRTSKLLADHDLQAAGSLGLSAATDVSSEDMDTVAAGERLLRAAADVVRDIGGDTLAGVLYSGLGRYTRPPTARGRAHAVEAIQRLADHAAASGIRLALEVVNRYETNLLNTAEAALDFIADVGRPNVFVHLDTYHMNIEEPDLITPVLACGGNLGYVHVGESHRGYLGSGAADLTGFFRALACVGYTGTITFESFSTAVADPALSTALAIWRDMWDDPADLARHARQTMCDHLRAATAAAWPGPGAGLRAAGASGRPAR